MATGRGWTAAEDKILLDTVNSGGTPSGAARKLIGRTGKACRVRLSRIRSGAVKRKSVPFSREEDAKLTELFNMGARDPEIAAALNRSRPSVFSRRMVLGLELPRGMRWQPKDAWMPTNESNDAFLEALAKVGRAPIPQKPQDVRRINRSKQYTYTLAGVSAGL